MNRLAAFLPSALFLLGGLVYFYYVFTLLPADATVVEVEQKFFHSRGGGHDEWFPTIRFATASGEVVNYRPEIQEQGGFKYRMEVGDRTTIYYDPADPQEVYFDDPFYRWVVPTLMVVGGAIFFLLALNPPSHDGGD